MPSLQYADLLRDYLDEGRRVSGVEDRNIQRQQDFTLDEFNRSNVPTFTEGDIDTMFSGKASDAAEEGNALFKQARAGLGEAGISGGGHALSTGSEIALRRMGQLTGARRDLRLFKAQADAQDRINRIRNAFQTGEVLGKAPSILYQDTLGEGVGAALGMEGVKAGAAAARDNARAQRRSGTLGLIGSIIGAI